MPVRDGYSIIHHSVKMMSLTRISSRLNRRVSFVVLCSYGALVLLLSLHHHQHVPARPGERIGFPVQMQNSHAHGAADCPLLHYAVTAFQYVPSGPSFMAPLPEHAFLPTHLLASVAVLMPGDRLSRAPPSNA